MCILEVTEVIKVAIQNWKFYCVLKRKSRLSVFVLSKCLG